MAGSSVTQTKTLYDAGGFCKISLACVGDDSTGAAPAATLSWDMTHWYLHSVRAYHTTAGAASPDIADVTVKIGNLDLLGGKGTNLVPAVGSTTTVNITKPYAAFAALYDYMPIDSASIVVETANQGTASAKWTIDLYFTRSLNKSNLAFP